MNGLQITSVETLPKEEDANRIYGVVTTTSGKEINPGFTTNQVLETAQYMEDCECDFYDVVCDLAILPKLLRDLVARIHELEGRSVS